MIGVGLRRDHFADVLQDKPQIDWFELLSENYLHKGSPNLQQVLEIRESYPMTMHGVGLSLGSADGIRADHLPRIQNLIDQIEPFLISEHLSWSSLGGVYLPDLLPVPYTDECAKIFIQNINTAQDYLKRELLIENPSSYFEYKSSEREEVEFLVSICQQSGAKILLDVNNIFVSCSNHGWDSAAYIQAVPQDMVKEIHIAGHSIKKLKSGTTLRIDTHDDHVCDEVWDLYHTAIARFGNIPTLLEWDDKIPPLDVLIKEAHKAAHAIA